MLRRNCDGCTICCIALTINDPDLVAPAGEACPHLAPHGCANHDGPRPKICGAYVCHYLMADEPLELADRPDHTGAIVGLSPLDGLHAVADCFVHVVEHRDGGLQNVLARPAWRTFMRDSLVQGRPVHIVRWDDPQQLEAALLRWHTGRLWMRLQPCDAGGRVATASVQPEHARPIPMAIDHPEWGYPFEARPLRQALGAAPELIVGADDPAGRHFRFTRWQAATTVAIERLLR